MLKTLRNNKKGFSLVELLVVVTIIAILSVVAYTAVGGQTAKARDARRKQDLNSLQTALEIYIQNNPAYPPSPDGLASSTTLAPLTASINGQPKILDKIPTDPFTFVDPVTFATRIQSYIYVTNGSSYQLATTLENAKGLDNDRAYVVGNGTGLLMLAVVPGRQDTSSGTAAACADAAAPITDGGTCLPYVVQ